MTLVYNGEIFAKYRALAVTSFSDLVIGKTYYGHFGTFTLAKFQTRNERWADLSLAPDTSADANNIEWMIGTDGTSHSLSDNNIGTSYNPWLLFDSEEIFKQCEKEFIVTYEPDGDEWDSYDPIYED